MQETPPPLIGAHTGPGESGLPVSVGQDIVHTLIGCLAIAWCLVGLGRFVLSCFLFALGGGSNFAWSSIMLLLANEAVPSAVVFLLLWWAWRLVQKDRRWALSVLPVSLVAGLLYLELTDLGGAGFYFFQLAQLFFTFESSMHN